MMEWMHFLWLRRGERKAVSISLFVLICISATSLSPSPSASRSPLPPVYACDPTGRGEVLLGSHPGLEHYPGVCNDTLLPIVCNDDSDCTVCLNNSRPFEQRLGPKCTMVGQSDPVCQAIGDTWTCTSLGAKCLLPEIVPRPKAVGCLETAYGGRVVCTSNDVRISSFVNVRVLDPCEFPGDTAVLSVAARLRIGALTRYDIGVFVATDGGNPRNGSNCKTFALPLPNRYVNNPITETTGAPQYWRNMENTLDDCCGDGTQPPQGSTNREDEPVIVMHNLTVVCSTGLTPDMVDLHACLSWENNEGSGCMDVDLLAPQTVTKCRCERVAGMVVPQPSKLVYIVEIGNVTDPVASSYPCFQFALTQLNRTNPLTGRMNPQTAKIFDPAKTVDPVCSGTSGVEWSSVAESSIGTGSLNAPPHPGTYTISLLTTLGGSATGTWAIEKMTCVTQKNPCTLDSITAWGAYDSSCTANAIDGGTFSCTKWEDCVLGVPSTYPGYNSATGLSWAFAYEQTCYPSNLNHTVAGTNVTCTIRMQYTPPSVSPTSSTTSSSSVTPTSTISTTSSTSVSPTGSATSSRSVTSTLSVSRTRSATSSRSVTPTISTTSSSSVSPTGSATSSRSVTPTISITSSSSVSPAGSATSSRSVTPTISTTSSSSVSPAGSATSSRSVTPTISTTSSSSVSPAGSATPSRSVTPTISITSSCSVSPTGTSSSSVTPTPTISTTSSSSVSPTVTPTISTTSSSSATSTISITASSSHLSTPSSFGSHSHSSTQSPSGSLTGTVSLTASQSATSTQTPQSSVGSSLTASGSPAWTDSTSVTASPGETNAIASLSGSPSPTRMLVSSSDSPIALGTNFIAPSPSPTNTMASPSQSGASITTSPSAISSNLPVASASESPTSVQSGALTGSVSVTASQQTMSVTGSQSIDSTSSESVSLSCSVSLPPAATAHTHCSSPKPSRSQSRSRSPLFCGEKDGDCKACHDQALSQSAMSVPCIYCHVGPNNGRCINSRTTPANFSLEQILSLYNAQCELRVPATAANFLGWNGKLESLCLYLEPSSAPFTATPFVLRVILTMVVAAALLCERC